MKPTKPHRTTTTIKQEGEISLKETIVSTNTIEPNFVYYEICEGKKSFLETNYNTAVDYFYRRSIFFQQFN